MSKRRCSPRVRVTKDGQTTISGLHYSDLSALLVHASLHWHAEHKDYEAGKKGCGRPGCLCAQSYHATTKWLIDTLKEMLDQQLRKGSSTPAPKTLKDILRERKEDRDIIDAIIAEAARKHEKG